MDVLTKRELREEKVKVNQQKLFQSIIVRIHISKVDTKIWIEDTDILQDDPFQYHTSRHENIPASPPGTRHRHAPRQNNPMLHITLWHISETIKLKI